MAPLFNQNFLTWSNSSINRTVGFSPLDLTSIHSWYDASDLSTITKDGSDRVSQWNDKAGSNNLVQATGGNQPLWLSANKNSLDVIDFVGSRWMDTSFTTLTNPVTIYLAVLNPSNDGNNHVFYDANTFLQGTFYKASSDDVFYFRADSTMFYFDETGHDSVWDYITTVFNGTSSKVRMTGNEVASGNAGTLSLDGLTVQSFGNASYYGNMKVGEIIIQDALATSDEIADTETYLKDKWGL